MLRLKPCFVILIFFLGSFHTYGQEGAVMYADQQVYDFGNIIETDGDACHQFTIKNTGATPLVITRVTTSCGCTTPEWTKVPIEPGNIGEIGIIYNPKGRPGPFVKNISVYSNGSKGAYKLTIRGNVVSKAPAPAINYAYGIGDLKMNTRNVSINNIRPDENITEIIKVRNDGDETIVIKNGKIPNYIDVNIDPEVLQPGETGEIEVIYDAKAVKKMGRIRNELPVSIERLDKKSVNGKIDISANIIDNFSKLSTSEKANAAKAELSASAIDFGTVEPKGNIIQGIIGGKTSETITITNTGKSNLQIHSLTSDHDLVDISGGKKELKPGASATYKITIKPKEIKTRLDTNLHLVCNDPNGPVKLIRVTAQR